jgi:alpha-1,3-rhamnosyl/mannosyltransferase
MDSGGIQEAPVLRIGIDISRSLGEAAGAGVYAKNLVQGLSRIDGENEYILYPFFPGCFPPEFRSATAPDAPNFRIHYAAYPEAVVRRFWAKNEGDPRRLLGDVDLVHSTAFTTPQAHPGKLVVTILDLIFLTHPQFHEEANRVYCLEETIKAVSSADHLIAISRHTKNELMRFFNVPKERITVTPLAAAEIFRPEGEGDEEVLRERYGLSSEYVLFVGSFEPRKNLRGLLQAFAILPEGLRRTHPLVLAGGRGWLTEDLPAFLEGLGLGPDAVRTLGYVPSADLPILYRGASVFVYPSFAEGFGLPVIEAMACGTPVLTSPVDALLEVGGNAVLYSDPNRPESISEGLLSLLQDGRTRESFLKKILNQAALFSWEETALRTCEVYKKALLDS